MQELTGTEIDAVSGVGATAIEYGDAAAAKKQPPRGPPPSHGGSPHVPVQ
jgi:hypothetical protein